MRRFPPLFWIVILFPVVQVQAQSGEPTLPVSMEEAPELRRKWSVRLDFGGTIPQDSKLTETGGPLNDGEMSLEPGFQFDATVGYRITPWLEVGPELGYTFNLVDSIGGWAYPDTTLGHFLMMAHVTLEYPPQGRFAPFAGAAAGGAASFLTFGSDYDYYYGSWSDGSGEDFVLAFQAFGGLRFRLHEDMSLGVIYRFLATDDQRWDVDWWSGADFEFAVDSIRMHTVSFVFAGRF